jgi:hypothetical protein
MRGDGDRCDASPREVLAAAHESGEGPLDGCDIRLVRKEGADVAAKIRRIFEPASRTISTLRLPLSPMK